MQSVPPEALARFWSKVTKTKTCWLWNGSGGLTGYGRIKINGRPILVHRFSYELHFGPIPPGMSICHGCPGGGTPGCVNPAHLRAGSPTSNMADARESGRMAIGERHGIAKLRTEQVRAIRSKANQGSSIRALSHEYSVDWNTIKSVVTHRTWRHVT